MVAYVSSNHFPEPLTLEEEKKYVNKFKNGDQKARNILIERNLRLVSHVAKKYNYGESEDLISIGIIGLIKAIETFKPEMGKRISSYAARCIDNEILMYIRANKKRRNDTSIDEKINTENEGHDITLGDLLYNKDYDIDDQVNFRFELKRMYETIKHCLQQREKLIVALRYGLINGCEKTQREIASLLGISRSYVSRIEKRALEKMNKTMKK
jgi:RNA polymerase sporulation-specific sigma factor